MSTASMQYDLGTNCSRATPWGVLPQPVVAKDAIDAGVTYARSWKFGHNEAAIGRPGPIALEVPIASCRSPDRWLFSSLSDVRSARAYRQGQVVRLRQGVWLPRP